MSAAVRELSLSTPFCRGMLQKAFLLGDSLTRIRKINNCLPFYVAISHSVRSCSEVSIGMEHLRILGIETSCDDTAAAVVRGDGKILSQVASSQLDLRPRWPLGEEYEDRKKYGSLAEKSESASVTYIHHQLFHAGRIVIN